MRGETRPRSSTKRSCGWSDTRTVDWQDRAHFLAVSATIMRRILVDAARARASTKRGGGLQRVDACAMNLDALPAAGTDRAMEMCALDDALNTLAQKDPRRAQVIELRFFGGLSVEETAEALESLPRRSCVTGSWRARGWRGSFADCRETPAPERPAVDLHSNS